MADDPSEDRAAALVDAFLQYRSMEQQQDYLLRGRRLAGLETAALHQDWIVAVRTWLARKDRTSERTMDDLTAELRLRGLEPPYDEVKQALDARFAGTAEAEQKKIRRAVAHQIDAFSRASDKPLH